MSKYGNIKVSRVIGGEKVTFDSKKEARYYDLYCQQLRKGIISELTLQPKYDLIPTVKHEGVTLRKITYSADFRYIQNGKTYVVDVKPSAKFQTDVYKLKKRLFLLKYTDLIFKEVY